MTDSGCSLENCFSKTALWNGNVRKDYVKFTDEPREMPNRHGFEVVDIRRESSSRLEDKTVRSQALSIAP
jgi:hypothetical protein